MARRSLHPIAGPAPLLLAAACLLAATTPASALDVDGFVKNFFLVQRLPHYDAAPGETAPGDPTLVEDILSTRLNLKGKPARWLDAGFSYNLAPRYLNDDYAKAFSAAAGRTVSVYRVDDPRLVLYPTHLDSTDNFVVTHNLDRLYLKFEAPRFDLTVGRQAVAWGSARGLNPTDVIAPFLFTEIDMENRLGVDAARLRIPTGDLGEVDTGYVAGKDAKFENSALYGRVREYVADMDVALTVMQFVRQTLLGVDVTRGVGGFGTWLEAAYVWVSDAAREASPLYGTQYDDTWWARLSTGADYTLTNGFYFFCEYHYNSPGSTDPHDYRYEVLKPAYTGGNVYLFGEHYLIPGFTWPVTPLWNATGSALWNIPDGSVLVTATAQYNFAENFYLDLAAFIGLGASPIYDPQGVGLPIVAPGIVIDPLATEFRSEFGAYPDTYYFTLRYYF